MPQKLKIVERQISELIPAEYNPRELTEKQFEDIKNSLVEFGFVDPVIVNMHPERNSVIVGGHQRVKVWASLGQKTAPTVEVSLDAKKEQELNIRLNSNSGQWDKDALLNFFDPEELRGWSSEFNGNFFDINIDKFGKDEEKEQPETSQEERIIHCPKCKHEFSILKEIKN